MQRNQWKTASEQLLSHWRRSGITHVPTGKPESIPSATEWLELNENSVFEDNDGYANNNATNGGVANDNATNDGAANSDTSTAVVIPASVQTHSISPSPLTTQVARPVGAVSDFVQGNWNTPSLDFVARQAAFQELNEQVMACRKCEDIVCRRQRTVFGAGPTTARIVMFGEAPGADEDRTGEPFVGAAGQLLDKILIASSLKRDEVYIMNSLKCRPPNNRTPVDSEIDNCRPFFESQLETIQPDYIVCWGAIAVRAVLKSTESVGRLRGKFHSYRGAKVMVTYHPAYLLRNPDAKKLTWEDMKMLMREIGIKVPGSA
ncbi:MAG: uracil-DNA glycosylase [Pirellula sp.]|nr:uracil-DNA glycosylase [Pirellula sp.]